MNIPNEMELKQEYIDIVHEIEETIWSKIESIRPNIPKNSSMASDCAKLRNELRAYEKS